MIRLVNRIRETSVTLEAEWTGMQSEFQFDVDSWQFEMHSNTSGYILIAFRTFGEVLEATSNVLNMFKTFEVHSKRRSIRGAFEEHPDCIPTILTTLDQHS